MFRWDRSSLEPFERTRAEIEFVSGLLVGGAAQERRVIDAVGARSRQGFLVGDLKRFRRPASACKRRQPYTLLAGVVVNDVLGARRTFERRDRSGCDVFDMDETRHAPGRRRRSAPAAGEPARPYHPRSYTRCPDRKRIRNASRRSLFPILERLSIRVQCRRERLRRRRVKHQQPGATIRPPIPEGCMT